MENFSYLIKCGAAASDITPDSSELPYLESLGRQRFGGILSPLHVRALVLQTGERTILFVNYELDKAPYPLETAERIAKRYGLDPKNIFMLAVHAHAMPVTGDRKKDGPNNIAAKPQEVIEATHRYEARILKIMEDTVDSAMRSVKPAVLRAGSGQSLINVDRKQWYFFEENGQPVSVLSLGSNRNTQIDHTVTVLRFDYEDGCPAAFFLNYPVHCSVMHGNSCCDGKMGISPDIAGSVSSALESKYPGSVALWISGAAGDINPILQTELYYPDPMTGKPHAERIPGDTTPLLRCMAGMLASDTEKVISEMKDNREILTDAVLGCTEAMITVAGKREPYKVRLRMLRIGNIVLLSASGELYASYAAAVKALLPDSPVILINHDSSNAFDSGYIPDDATLLADKVELPGLRDSDLLPGTFLPEFQKAIRTMYKDLFASHAA